MERSDELEAVQERFREFGEVLLQLSERPDTLGGLAEAFESGDTNQFGTLLAQVMPSLPTGPEKCDPYIRSVLILLEPGHYECTWGIFGTATIKNPSVAQALTTGVLASDLRKQLQKAGILSCRWVPPEGKVVDVFVQGVCPPGTF